MGGACVVVARPAGSAERKRLEPSFPHRIPAVVQLRIARGQAPAVLNPGCMYVSEYPAARARPPAFPVTSSGPAAGSHTREERTLHLSVGWPAAMSYASILAGDIAARATPCEEAVWGGIAIAERLRALLCRALAGYILLEYTPVEYSHPLSREGPWGCKPPGLSPHLRCVRFPYRFREAFSRHRSVGGNLYHRPIGSAHAPFDQGPRANLPKVCKRSRGATLSGRDRIRNRNRARNRIRPSSGLN